MEKLSKLVISRLALRQQPGTDHPDPDILAAFAESRLSARERTKVLGHLSRCPVCREVAALMSAGDGSLDSPPFAAARRQVGLWRWAATAAVACLVMAVIWSPEFVRKNSERPPAPAPPTPPARMPSAEVSQSLTPKPQRAGIERQTKQRKVSPREESAPPMAKPEVQSEITATASPPSAPVPDSEVSARAQQFVGGRAFQFRSRRTTEGSRGILWSLPSSGSASGTLQRSEDGGRTWQNVLVDGHSQLYALAATGSEVWAGGADGALFHSVDNGAHWTPVPVSDGVNQLSDTITRIDVRGGEFIYLQVKGGNSWVTTDGGLHWQPE